MPVTAGPLPAVVVVRVSKYSFLDSGKAPGPLSSGLFYFFNRWPWRLAPIPSLCAYPRVNYYLYRRSICVHQFHAHPAEK